MFRPAKFISESIRQKDWLGLFMFTCGALISCWVISIVFSQTSRELAIRRFQLASPSFYSWAAMGPVPSMYNFENRIQFTNDLDIEDLRGEDAVSKQRESWFSCQVNHFPARCATFGEFSPTWFASEKQGTFEMSTRFRETELVSRWEITQQQDGTMKVRRVFEDWVQHDASE